MFDILVIVAPFPILRQLQLDVRKKIGLGVLFGLGIFVTIVQLMRIQTIASLKSYTDSEGPVMWSMLEIHVGVIISCIPTYTPLLRRMRDRITTYSNSRGKSGADAEESGRFRVSKMPSSAIKSVGKSKASGSRMSTIMDDEIALCEVNAHSDKAWVGRKAAFNSEAYHGNSQHKGLRDAFEMPDDGGITVTQEIRVHGDGSG